MIPNKLRLLAVAAFLIIVPATGSAQSASQAAQMLQSNPGLLRELRSRIMSSGLTPDQVRARLRAEGYPEDLLDAYLPGGTESGVESTGTTGVAPGEDVFNAISALGIVDTVDATTLRCSVESLDTTLVAADTFALDASRRSPTSASSRRSAPRERGGSPLATASP